MKNANQSLIVKNREQQTRMVEQNNTIESLKSQLGELSSVLRNKDSSLAKETASRRDAEIEIDRLHVKLDDAERALETNKPAESENSQLEALRQIALCAVCRGRFKNTAIRTCGHVFCKQCADERIASRSRKCPNCGRPFASSDLISVHL